MATVTQLQINYLTQPAGITESPQFSWMIEGEERNLIQKGYQLQIGSEPSENALIFDSGLVDGKDSAHVRAAGFEPESAHKYYVRVRAVLGSRFGEPNVSSGAMNATSGETNVSSGAMNATSGEPNVSSGAMNATSGETNVSSGVMNAASDATNASFGELNATSGATNPISGVADVGPDGQENSDGAVDTGFSNWTWFISGLIDHSEWQGQFIQEKQKMIPRNLMPPSCAAAFL